MPKLTVTIEWNEHPAMDPQNVTAMRGEIERVVRGSATNLRDHLYARMLPNGISGVTSEVGDLEE
jgi:hypothetical protein